MPRKKSTTNVKVAPTQEELILLQEKLDYTKYLQSETAKTDLSGKMSYCENCSFRLPELDLDTGKTSYFCELDYESARKNTVCAYNYLKNKEKK